MNDMVVHEQPRSLTVAEVRGRVNLIQQVMGSIMKDGTHYGTIPGTDKPSLLKPGAEVLVSTFMIAVNPEVEDLSVADEIRYRVRCVGTHQSSGVVIGAGIGECSSSEEKYKWRRAVCDEEFDVAEFDRKRTKYARGKNNSHYTVKQIRTEPADVANTVLKMAKKRALVDFTLTALAASDIFAQDLEDMPEEVREAVTEGDKSAKKKVQQPKAKSEQQEQAPAVDPAKKINEGQVSLLQRKLEGAGMSAEEFCKQFGIAALPELPFGKINEALKCLAEKTPE